MKYALLLKPDKKGSLLITVLGIDPGGTTGVAIGTFTLNDRTSLKWLEAKEVKSPFFNQWLQKTIPTVDYVVCEDFLIKPHVKAWANTTQTSGTTDTPKLIGRVEFACFVYGKPFAAQPPSDKSFAYSLLGMTYIQGKKGQHKFDAMAHARLFMRKKFGL